MAKRALVVFSGGQDSTTCLYEAKNAGFEVHALTFDYGQRHAIEIQSARQIAKMAQVASHEILVVGSILKGTSPLISGEKLEQYENHELLPGGLEKTFVPMRNQLFLTIAANRAFVLGTNIVYTGVSQEDFGGYPDCRRGFIRSFEHTSSEGTFNNDAGFDGLKVMTPLMYMNKAETVKFALELPGCYEALAFSHTAYDGQYPPTGKDHASLLRAKGFEHAMVPDPLVLRAYLQGYMELPDAPNYVKPLVDKYGIRVVQAMAQVAGRVYV